VHLFRASFVPYVAVRTFDLIGLEIPIFGKSGVEGFTSVLGMLNTSSHPCPVKLRSLLGGVALALALLVPASASAWVKETAPAIGAPFQEGASMSVLPDGSVRYIGAVGASNPYTNRLVVRPPSGPVAFAPLFPTALGQGSSTNLLFLSPQDASGNQLVVRENSPYNTAYLAAGGDPGAVTPEPVQQVVAIDLAPSGEAAAIISTGSEAAVRFRPAGPGGAWDTPRPVDSAGNMFSYGYAITVDPDGGVFIIYKTAQEPVLLQAYAPPGKPFGAPQQVDIDDLALNLTAYRYGASSDGHGVFAWDESTGGDTNSEEVWAMTRAPGGLLGDKRKIADARAGGLVTVHAAAATDDGASYVSYLDSGPIACPNNYRFGGSVLAVKPGGGDWSKLNTPSTGNDRMTIESIKTAGNAVGVLASRTTYPGNICTDKDPSSAIEVQLGQGASLGPAQVIASETITNGTNSTIDRPRGFAVNAGGAAAALVSEPVDAANNQAHNLYWQAGTPVGPPTPPDKPLPAPGKILISGKKLVVRTGKTSFKASCQRLPGEGAKLFCSVTALLAIEEKLGGGKKRVARVSAKQGKVKLKTIATAKPVKIPVGKTKEVTLTLNKLGKKKLAAAKKAGLSVRLKVTFKRAGYATNTLEKKLKLVAGKAKGKKGK